MYATEQLSATSNAAIFVPRSANLDPRSETMIFTDGDPCKYTVLLTAAHRSCDA